MQNLKTKYGDTALVTGASSGIGKAFATALAKQGVKPILVARNLQRLQALADELKANYNINTPLYSVDLSDIEAVRAFTKTIDNYDISVFVHSAGLENNGSFIKIAAEKELNVINVNVVATYVLTKYFAEKMSKKRRGGILLVSSMIGLMPSPYFSNYTASKAYTHYLGTSLTTELKEHNVDVSVLAPGLTDTPMKDSTGVDWAKMPMASMTPERVAQLALGKLGKTSSIIPGLMNQMMVVMARLSPQKIFSSMNGWMIKRGIAIENI